MKVNDILTEKPKYKLFCDLDGVLVDYDRKIAEVFHLKPEEVPAFMEKSAAHARINGYVKKGNKFFSEMHPMPDGMELWNYIKKHDPTILSSKGRVTNAEEEKKEWIADHLGDDAKKRAIIVRSSAAKADYASPTSVLIDDREESLAPWREAGGIAIKHVSAKDTINQLKELGL